MNIYLYLKHFPPFGDGVVMHKGTVKAVHGLACGLVNCGAKVTILCEGWLSEDCHESSYQTDAGYEIKWFANPKKHMSFNISAGLQKYIQNFMQPGLVVLNGIFNPSVNAMSRLLKKHDIPYVISPFDPYHPSIFSKNAHLKWPYWYLLERQMLRQATAIQLLDIRHTEWLRRLEVHTPTIEIPCGFSDENILPESTLQWKENENFRILFLGRIDAHNKGLDLLLDAFAQISEENEAQLIIQGPDNGDKKMLQAQAIKLSVSKRVSFLEPDFNRSASLIAGNYDIFCLPSRFEGFSQAALEAMLAGRVLLVSEVAGIAPHVQASGCGLTITPEVSAIKDGLTELFKLRPKWRKMGLCGRDYVLNNLQWDRIAFTALEHYRELVHS